MGQLQKLEINPDPEIAVELKREIMNKQSLALCFLINLSILSALTTKPELDISVQEEISGLKHQFHEKLRKARLLLRSDKMDHAFSIALNEVLQERLSKPRVFESIIKAVGPKASLSRLVPETPQSQLYRYSKKLKEQADLFYILTQAAHHDEIEEFNMVCRKMIRELEALDNIENSLAKRGILSDVLRVRPSARKTRVSGQVHGSM
jgi:hypothetical protein